VKRAAIFQYQWPLQSHIVNLAEALASSGYEVEIFIKDCSSDLVDLARLQMLSRINIISFNSTSAGSRQKILLRRLHGLYEHAMKRFSYAPIIIPSVVAAFRYVRRKRYSFFIGIEKMGLIWAGFLSELTGTPFVYYSLELYDEEHPDFNGLPRGFSALRRMEKKYHRKASATIIQDRLRGDYLFRSNGIIDNTMILLPVSVPELPAGHKVNYYRSHWGIPPELPVVLYLGFIMERRQCIDLAYVARDHVNRFRIVYHGYGDAIFLDKILRVSGGAVTLSTELVPENLLSSVVAAADIGLAFYGNDCANAFSSEKVAIYCRAGVPFIAFDTESYRELIEYFRCCVLIKDIQELPQAVSAILNDYSAYRTNALRAFRKYYQFETNVAQVIKQLENIFKK
jgi:glycosyltransferase involved in cell wall biosynthesis